MRGFGIGVIAAAMIWAGGQPALVRADQQQDTDEKVTMGEVVVTASREKEAAAKVPAEVVVIDAQQIARTNAQNVPEVLQWANLHVSDIGGNSRNYNIDLRGFGDNAPANLLVLVDGRRINEADLSVADWALIPLARIARIEIISGPRGAVLYGDNATGGVINIITQEGSGLQVEAGAAYGSYDTYKGSAGVGGGAGIFSYNLSASYLNSDGYRDNSATEAKDAGANLRLDPLPNLGISFSGGYHKDDTGLPGAILQSQFDQGASRTTSFYPNDFADTEDYYINNGYEFFFLSDDAFRLDLSYRDRTVEQYASFSDGYFTGDTDIDTLAAAPRFTFQGNFGDVSNRIIFGGDLSRNAEDILNTSSYLGAATTDTYHLKRTNYGYFADDDLGVTRNLSLSGGYRHERAEYSFSSGSADDRTFDEEAFTTGINYQLGPAKVYASYGRSFRYPLLDEMFNFMANSVLPDLEPQLSHNLEAGTKFSLLQDLSFAFDLFRIRTEKEIFYNPNAGMFGANQNLDGKTDRSGFDVRLAYLHNGWDGGAAYTFTDAQIEGGQYAGGKIPNVPEHKAAAHLGYKFDMGLYLGLNTIYVGSRYLIGDFNNLFVKQDAYTLLNAKVKYDWRLLTFFVDLNNILNKEYASFGGLNFLNEAGYYPSPKFNFLAGVSARFGSK